MTSLFKKLAKQLKKNQSPMRFQHSLNVSHLAGELAEIHGVDPGRARLCGLLHDWAKEWAPVKLIAYVKKYRIRVPYIGLSMKGNPNNLHAYVGAHVAQYHKWVTRAESHAMASHTFGSERMNLLDKIIYVADFSSPDRRFKKAKSVRKKAFKNIEKAFLMALSYKIKHQMQKKRTVHPLSIKMWNHEIQ